MIKGNSLKWFIRSYLLYIGKIQSNHIRRIIFAYLSPTHPINILNELGQLLVSHKDPAYVGEGVCWATAYLGDLEGIEGIQSSRGGCLIELGVDLKVLVESPAHQHDLVAHVLDQGKAVILPTLQVNEIEVELGIEHINSSWFAELLLP